MCTDLTVAVSEYIKGSKERYLLGQDKTRKFRGNAPFVQLQNDT